MSNRKDPIPIHKQLIPTPASEPQPLTFPKPALTDEQLRNLVADYVSHVLYKAAFQLTDLEIVHMGEEEFRMFCRRVLEDKHG